MKRADFVFCTEPARNNLMPPALSKNRKILRSEFKFLRFKPNRLGVKRKFLRWVT